MIQFRVLGSLEVVGQDGPLALGGRKQRALLAVLVVHRGEPVSSERLIDELWGEQAPPSAVKLVQGHVSNLRRALGDGLLVTEPGGYLLRITPDQLDVDRFESLVAAGRQALAGGDPRTAAARLREALEVWRGPALADLAYESFAQSEIARLEESRLAALEARIEAELALGGHAELVGELEALVREHPLRERLVGQLMLALYRSGRQADALEAYREARRRLVEELGLEPGRELQELERAILTQDPALEPPSRGSNRRLSAIARRRRRGPLLIVAGGIVLLTAVIAVALKPTRSGVRVTVAPNSLAAIDVGRNRVTAAVPVGARPGAVAYGSGSLWVANLDDQTVSRVDPGALRTLRVISISAPPTGIAASANGIWVVEANLSMRYGPATSSSSVSVERVDPEFNSPGAPVPIDNVVPGGPAAIAAHGNSVWVAPATGLLTRLDAGTGTVRQQLDPNADPAGIAIGEGAIWLTDTGAGNVVRVDTTGLSTPIPVGNGPTGVTVAAGGVWVVDSIDDAVVRVDPDTRAVTATIPVGRTPAGIAFGAGSVWVANSGDGTVTRINPSTGKVMSTIAVGGSPQALAIAGGKVWVTVDARSIAPPSEGSGGGTLQIVSPDIHFMDPALAYEPPYAQLLYATCAQLVNYPDKAGPAGSQLVPEVAQALPTRSPDGRTYMFRVRPGFRFSPPSREAVTAQTFKASIERTLNPRMQSLWAHFLADVVGAGAYMRGKASHVTGVIASGDTLTIKLVSPAPDFLSRLALPAFCAVPSDTPIDRNGVGVIPSAGPYYVTSFTPGQGVVLTRNPNYDGNRPRHFARIQLAFGLSAQRAVREITAGTADYTQLGWETPSRSLAALSSGIAARYGPGSPAAARGAQQYFINPALQLDYFVLNTHRALFSDVRMRQAVNYAIDRRALTRRGDFFVPLPARPTDHYLPPGMPGFRGTPVYSISPNVPKARALAQGGGRTAVLYTCDTFPCPEQAQIVKTNLAAIGLRVQINVFPLATLFSREARPGEPFDLAWQGWSPDYLDPASMLTGILENSSWGPTFDDPTYRRRLAAAARLSGPERYLTYGQLDIDLARNAAPLAAFGNLSSHDLFSARIGCQTYGIYGIDLSALCTKRPPR